VQRLPARGFCPAVGNEPVMSKGNRLLFAISAIATLGLGLSSAAGVLASTPAAAVATQEQVAATVGEFAVQLAGALQLPGPSGGFNAESASLALWKVGVKVTPDFRKPLTEADVTSTLGQLGFTLTSEDPGRVVSRERSSTIIGTFVGSGTLPGRVKQSISDTAAGNGGDDFNNGNGKGGKYKRKSHQSPSSGEAPVY